MIVRFSVSKMQHYISKLMPLNLPVHGIVVFFSFNSANLFDKKQKDGKFGPGVGTEEEKPSTMDFCSDGRARVSSSNVSGQCVYLQQSAKKEEQTQPEEHGLDGVTHSTPTTCDPADLGKMKESLKPKKCLRNGSRGLAENLGVWDSEVRPGHRLNDDNSKISQEPKCYVKIIEEEFRRV